MRYVQILFCLLLGCSSLMAMSDSIEQKNSNIICIENEHIPHIKALKKLLAGKDITKLPFTPEIEAYLGDPLFPALTLLLDKALPKMCDLPEIVKSSIADIIESKKCSSRALCELLSLVYHLDIECLYYPMLVVIAKKLCEAYKNNEQDQVLLILEKLTPEQQKKIKLILAEQVGSDFLPHLIEKVRPFQIADIAQLTPGGQYFVVNLPQLTLVYGRNGALLHRFNRTVKQTAVFYNSTHLVTCDFSDLKATVHRFDTGELVQTFDLPQQKKARIQLCENFLIVFNDQVLKARKIDEKNGTWCAFDNAGKQVSTDDTQIPFVIGVTPDETKLICINLIEKKILLYSIKNQQLICKRGFCNTFISQKIESPSLAITNDYFIFTYFHIHCDMRLFSKEGYAIHRPDMEMGVCEPVSGTANFSYHPSWLQKYHIQLSDQNELLISAAGYEKQADGSELRKDMPQELRCVGETDDKSIIILSKIQPSNIRYGLDIANIIDHYTVEQILALIFKNNA